MLSFPGREVFISTYSISRPRRNDQLNECAQNNAALEGHVPVFEIFDVARDAILDVGIITCLTAKSAHLGQTGYARKHFAPPVASPVVISAIACEVSLFLQIQL